MNRRPIRVVIALGMPVIALVAGCGSSGLSPAQVRAQATRICTQAANRTARLTLPSAPSGGKRFLSAGIAVIAPELRDLRELGNSGALGTAVAATGGELTALRSSLRGLRAGNDPVVAIKTLEQELAPFEQRANAAWRRLRVPACVSR